MESDTELAKKLEVVAKNIPNLVDAGMDIGFPDQSIEFDMEIVEHLVIDDSVVVGGELCVAEHLVVRNETTSVGSLAYVAEGFHIIVDVECVFLVWIH